MPFAATQRPSTYKLDLLSSLCSPSLRLICLVLVPNDLPNVFCLTNQVRLLETSWVELDPASRSPSAASKCSNIKALHVSLLANAKRTWFALTLWYRFDIRFETQVVGIWIGLGSFGRLFHRPGSSGCSIRIFRSASYDLDVHPTTRMSERERGRVGEGG